MKFSIVFVIIFCSGLLSPFSIKAQEFQGKAEYIYKAKMSLGRWGAKMSEAQKKQIAERLKNRLEKKYILTFSREASLYKEYEKLDAISGATDSWGKNFTPGEQYKNLKTTDFIQEQEFYGKKFLVKDSLLHIEWKIGTDTKQIGNYLCFKATAEVPSSNMAFWEFSWSKLRAQQNANKDEEKNLNESITEIIAWFSPQIPISQGPSEFYGLPGLILEVNCGTTSILCSKIILNPEDKIKVEAPKRGKVVTKQVYKEIIFKKMKEFRDSRSGRRRS